MAELPPELRYIQYEHALEKKYLPSIRALISKDLSEPYSIYVYRYFLYQWGDLCFMVCSSLPSGQGRNFNLMPHFRLLNRSGIQ
jgi:hypothetical protein